MGLTCTEIRLENAGDTRDVRKGKLKASEIPYVEARVLVDTGSYYLVINEETRRKLNLDILIEDTTELADGVVRHCGISEPVTVYWHDRRATCEAMVLPDGEAAILGAIPMEIMDITVKPKGGKLEVVGTHGDRFVAIAKQGVPIVLGQKVESFH